MHITPLGDSALLVQLCERLADEPETTLREVVAAWRKLEAAALPGVIEVSPAYTTLSVYYDPLHVIGSAGVEKDCAKWLSERIAAALTAPGENSELAARLVEIPVCYGGEFGPDLTEVAGHTQLTPEEVAERHAGAEYLVHCLGFTPGFPYLSGLPPELAAPRRASPRKEVPAGSVGIGGQQTGIYPIASPGGWHLIGRTPLRLFDPAAETPTLLQVGDRVRFRPISAHELEAWPR